MLVEFGKANYLDKARQQPEKVRQVIDKVKTDGLKPTVNAVFNKLNQPLPLGYCNVGQVIGIGQGVSEFTIGDKVVSNGPHAEIVNVPKNLVAKVPEGISDQEAAFTVIGAIGLQGIRLCNPTLGETIVVVGLGLIGLITAQLLKANGCKVIGFDFDQKKINLANEQGIDAVNLSDGTDPVQYAMSYSNHVGVDGVIITASNKNNDIISQAANMSRKKGRIILVGVIGLNINRSDFYEKELTFQVSCSYGPGRYDEEYELKGNDYPISHVRWTEKRNFEAVLHAIKSKTLNVKPLISEEISLDDVVSTYNNISSSKSIATIIKYSNNPSVNSSVQVNAKDYNGSKGVLGVIGAGNFTSSTILPSLSKVAAKIKYIASSGGLSSTTLAKKFGVGHSTTDYREILSDKEVDTILVTTRHNSHASLAVEILKAQKHVFVEKPLALNESELDKIIKEQKKSEGSVTVGFNRRFSPHTIAIKKALGNDNSAINIIATMNAGFIPKDMWVHDLDIGGGRIIGEACHFMDLSVYLTGSKIKSVCMSSMGVNTDESTDNASILLKFENGSNGVINYFANGSKAYSKERVEIYSQERTAVIDNFRKTKFFGFKGSSNVNTKQDKGHFNQFKLYHDFITRGGKPIIPFDEIVNVTKVSFGAITSLKENSWIDV